MARLKLQPTWLHEPKNYSQQQHEGSTMPKAKARSTSAYSMTDRQPLEPDVIQAIEKALDHKLNEEQLTRLATLRWFAENADTAEQSTPSGAKIKLRAKRVSRALSGAMQELNFFSDVEARSRSTPDDAPDYPDLIASGMLFRAATDRYRDLTPNREALICLNFRIKAAIESFELAQKDILAEGRPGGEPKHTQARKFLRALADVHLEAAGELPSVSSSRHAGIKGPALKYFQVSLKALLGDRLTVPRRGLDEFIRLECKRWRADRKRSSHNPDESTKRRHRSRR